QSKIKVAVVMGGYTAERHISMESGRNIYEKLASSSRYQPIPVFLIGNATAYSMYLLQIHMMLNDNADDIAAYITSRHHNKGIEEIRHTAKAIFSAYSINTDDVAANNTIDVQWLKNNT